MQWTVFTALGDDVPCTPPFPKITSFDEVPAVFHVYQCFCVCLLQTSTLSNGWGHIPELAGVSHLIFGSNVFCAVAAVAFP